MTVLLLLLVLVLILDNGALLTVLDELLKAEGEDVLDEEACSVWLATKLVLVLLESDKIVKWWIFFGIIVKIKNLFCLLAWLLNDIIFSRKNSKKDSNF